MRKFMVVLALFFACFLNAFNDFASSNKLHDIDTFHAKKLSTLVVQGFDGRMKPFDTVALEIMHKVYDGEIYKGLNHNEAMLSIMINPDYWRDADIIKVSNDEIKDILGISRNSTHAKFADFYAMDENNKIYYKIGKLVEEANRKPIGNRTTFDKDLLKVDERVNIFYLTFMNEIFRIIPSQNTDDHTWYSPANALTSFSEKEALRVSEVLRGYFEEAMKAQISGDWSVADKGLKNLKNYQQEYGVNIIPSQRKLNFEVLFNEIKIFERLMPIYLLAGGLLLIFVFIRLLRPNVNINYAFKLVYAVNFIAFICHTAGLGIRWYIAEHAPWSNAYESLVYIAWALSLSGIVFSKRSPISLALTSILAGVTLFVAHLNMMDPQITNIQPVLNSYWLVIHVSVITASYGFLGLCALLGLFTLVLFIIDNNKNDPHIRTNILEATRINEMSMILGLCLLTVGNFLGGVWANESWGRYWGWDSKETWSLITILVYASVVHFRFIPRLNSQYAFAVASMFAYASVIMTYFGVNFYLTGMHSYAAGESIPIPNVVWMSAVVLCLIAFVSFFKRENSAKL
ncbi:MAG: cytochrome c biogenesis protein CcsA [Campylobacter sp.]|nr:cytochrome c biogenesis protein CcsA [Campylobacter sp.]